jgi:hypothetical protein
MDGLVTLMTLKRARKGEDATCNTGVMGVLVPATHAITGRRRERVDGRDEPVHDG